MSEPKCKCFFGTESRRPWQPTCESATQPTTSDAHSGNVHGCFFVQQLQALRKTLYSGAAQATRVPRWPCTALSRPASPPSYLPSLSKLWKSPADLQPSCHSENVTCRTKCSVASQMALNLPACSCLYYHWKQVALAECSSSIGGCIGKKFIKNLKIDP